MLRHRFSLPAALLLCACSQDPASGAEGEQPSTSDPGGSMSNGQPGSTGVGPSTGAESSEDGGIQPPKYDVHRIPDECDGKANGFYCDSDKSAFSCTDGLLGPTIDCQPGRCVEDVGCVTCVEGQARCSGPRVMECDVSGAEPRWSEIEVCDPLEDMACDVGMRTCVPLTPIGSTTPTGRYYQYSLYDATSDGLSGVSDADSWGNFIYVTAWGGGSGTVIAKYEVEIEDTDGDGVKEPNQHPDNPDDEGPIEKRTFKHIENYAVANPAVGGPNTMEIYALADRLYYGGDMLSEFTFDSGDTETFAPGPSFATFGLANMSFLAYNDVWKEWFSGSEGARRVIRYDEETQAWGWAFQFPELAGAHMDGIEVVVAPDGTPYMYVSDMTSDFIGQYREDPEMGWIQVNLFEYDEPAGNSLEGFGFGALGHFWVGSLANTFYELGGGDLAEYLEDPLAPG